MAPKHQDQARTSEPHRPDDFAQVDSSRASMPTCRPWLMTGSAVPSSIANSTDGSTATPASSRLTARQSSPGIVPILRRPPTSCSPSPVWRRGASHSAGMHRQPIMADDNGVLSSAILSLLVAADQCCPAIIGQAHLLYHARSSVQPPTPANTLAQLKRAADDLVRAIAKVEAAMKRAG